jgi:hypothetical protein
LIDELIGDCANYPEYGRVRHFRLRGMELTLQISDLKISPNQYEPPGGPKIQELYVDVFVKRDTSAASAIAEPPLYTKPPDCH